MRRCTCGGEAVPLVSGDDKFLTRWMVNHGWEVAMQIGKECTLASTFRADYTLLFQILRWARNTWRSDLKSIFLERNIWYRYPYQTFLMIDRMLQPFYLLLGPFLFGTRCNDPAAS